MNKSLLYATVLSVIGALTQQLFGLGSVSYQLLYLMMGLSIYFLIKKIDSFHLIRLSTVISFIGVFLLLILLFIGDPTRGAKRWFFIFGFGLQPSMVFVPFFALSLVLYLVDNPIKSFIQLVQLTALLLIPAFLIFKQPDLGTSIIVFTTLMSVILYSGFTIRYFLPSLILVPFFALAPKILKPYQIQRLTSFINPHIDPSGINYNSLQSVIAIGSGGLFGKGFLNASQSKLYYLPEAHTDFVFASFTETFGFIGAALLILIYFLLLKTLLSDIDSIGKKNRAYEFFSIGLFIFIFVQFVFNIGMNLRLLPVVGIPLPFMSYGGSSLLTLYLFLALREKLRHM